MPFKYFFFFFLTDLLQTTGEEAGHALERPGDGDDLLSKVIQHMDGEGPHGAAALSVQTVVLLHSVEHVLAQAVAHLVLVVALKADQGCRGKVQYLVVVVVVGVVFVVQHHFARMLLILQHIWQDFPKDFLFVCRSTKMHRFIFIYVALSKRR